MASRRSAEPRPGYWLAACGQLRHQEVAQSMHWLPILFLLLTAGCVGSVKSLYPPAPGEAARTVYVVNHAGRHTGIAVERADIPPDLWPAYHDYPDARYLKLGWGDDVGYHKDLKTGIVAKALV